MSRVGRKNLNLNGLLDNSEAFQPRSKFNLPIKKKKKDLENEYEDKVFIPLYSKISMFSWKNMKAMADVTIKSYDAKAVDAGTISDPRMGPTLNFLLTEERKGQDECANCSLKECPGHYGLIEFDTWVYNPTVLAIAVQIAKCVCHDCGQLLIEDQAFKSKKLGSLPFMQRLKELVAHCVGNNCLRENGSEKTRPCAKNPTFITKEMKSTGEFEVKYEGKDKKTSQYKMDPVKLAEIFRGLSDKTIRMLGFSPGCSPENMLMRGILVSPNVARPVSMSDGRPKVSPLTTSLRSIAKAALTKEPPSRIYAEIHKLIFKKTDEEKSRDKSNGRDDTEVTLISMIQGKHGIVRMGMAGKRLNNSARTVASPLDTLRFGEVGVPKIWAEIILKVEKVQPYNLEYLYDLLLRGEIKRIIDQNTGVGRRPTKKSKLIIGDTVERFLQDGDIVCDNRQPTLHRFSFMGYRVRLYDSKTHCNHVAVLGSKNNDYDGDENNLWGIVNPEAEAEAFEIVNCAENIMSSAKNAPNVSLILHSILGGYILTGYEKIDDGKVHDLLIEDDLFEFLLNIRENKNGDDTLGRRLRKYNVHPRSGRALLSSLFPDDFNYTFSNFAIREGVVQNAILEDGHIEKSRINKKIMGGGNRSIIQEMYGFYGTLGKHYVSQFLTDTPRVIGRFMMEYGFTVGIDDCIFVGNLKHSKHDDGKEYDLAKELNKKVIAEVRLNIESFGGKLDNPLEEEFRQLQINDVVNKAETSGTIVASQLFTKDNSFYSMCEFEDPNLGGASIGSGTKGSVGNIGQMLVSIAQQFIEGQRPPPQMTNGTRSSVTCFPNDISAEANGFIVESFMEGLSPRSMWFLMKATREGLLATAIKTADIGTLGKRLCKVQENKVIANDLSVRNTIGYFLSPIHNAGYRTEDVVKIKSETNDYQTMFCDLETIAESLNVKAGFVRTKFINKDEHSFPNDEILGNDDFEQDFEEEIERDLVYIDEFVNMNKRHGKFERSNIIQKRTMQIYNGAPPRFNSLEDIAGIKGMRNVSFIGDLRAFEIAHAEYYLGLLDDLSVIRTYPGSEPEIIPASWEFLDVPTIKTKTGFARVDSGLSGRMTFVPLDRLHEDMYEDFPQMTRFSGTVWENE